jgi:hypothetical protein
MNEHERALLDLEGRKLDLEREKAKLNFRKFVLGSVFAAIAIAAIPPLFQLATAVVKSSENQHLAEQNRAAEILRNEEETYFVFVKEFLASAMNQDIELRLRVAEYLSFVSLDKYKDAWKGYFDSVTKQREQTQQTIDRLEKELDEARSKTTPKSELFRLERNLAWAYASVGYVRRDPRPDLNATATKP